MKEMLFNNPLFDFEFLKELDKQNNKEIFARVISLTFQETPVETIEGKITSGNISIDGASAIRRTCSLSMVAKDLDINSFYWGVKTKFKLEIGLTNTLKNIPYDFDEKRNPLYWGDKYPQDIIWFPQGIYVITSFNTSQSINNFTISISGKDKMCLLNGELGGHLPMSVDFGTQEFLDKETNTTTYEKITIKNIIREALHTYALEPYHNIVINDLDEAGLELLEYRGDEPLYLLNNVDVNEYGIVMRKKDEEKPVYLCAWNDSKQEYELLNPKSPDVRKSNNEKTKLNNINYSPRVDKLKENNADIFVLEVEKTKDEKSYYISPKASVYKAVKLEYGQTAGYRITNLIYPGDLISSIGESLTSILDKIKNMLGEYEYFYDLDGRFIFQRKKNYIQSTFNGEVNNDQDRFIENSAYNGQIIYRFEGGNLITSYQNAPDLTNLKNDYAIWGTRKSVSGEELLIHYRYAIDTKPIRYTQITIEEDDVNKLKALTPNVNFKPRSDVKTFVSTEIGEEGLVNADDNSIIVVDWREIIYQMALDYYQYNQLDDFIIKIIEANKNKNIFNKDYNYLNEDLYVDGTTSYEKYYMDIQGFWRQLYDIDPKKVYPNIDSTFQKEDSFSLLDTKNKGQYLMDLYTKFKYEVWTHNKKIPYEDIVILTEPNKDGRRELQYLLDILKIDLIENPGLDDKGQPVDQEDGVLKYTINSLGIAKEKLYINCGVSESSDGKIAIVEKNQAYTGKNDLYVKVALQKKDIDIENLIWKYNNVEYEVYHNESETEYYTYLSLLEYLIKKQYYDKQEKPNNWFYKIYLPEDEKDLYPFFERKEDGSINSWAIDCGLGFYYFKDYQGFQNKDKTTQPYSYVPYSKYDLVGNQIESIESEKRYIDFYKSDYDFYLINNEKIQQERFWNKNVNTAPDLLNFWMDFLEEGELDQFSIQAVGDRTKVVNDKDVKSIYFRDVPEIIFMNKPTDEEYEEQMRLVDASNYYHFTRIRNVPMNLFSISAQGKSAQDELENLLYNHSYCVESITLQSLPIYYLEPNTRIFVRDDLSKINGEYIISRLSIPLNYNGTMTINATKAPTRLY